MLKATLKRALIGVIIGILMGDGIAIITSLMSGGEFMPVSETLRNSCSGTVPAFIVQTIVSGLYGAVCFAGISLYEIERMPMALASALHCLGIVLLFIPIGFCLGWAQTVAEFLIMAAIQTASYFVVWLILYLSYRRQVKELNMLQKQIQDKTAPKNNSNKEVQQ